MGEQSRNDAGNSTGGAPPFTPLRGFILAAAVAATGGLLIAGLAASRESDGSARVTPAPTTEVSSPITSKGSPEVAGPDTGEALAIFTELRNRLEVVYRRRDPGALTAVVKPGSAQFRAVRRDLRLLATNNLLDRTRVRTIDLEVVESEAQRLVVRERVVIRARYLDDSTYVEVDVDIARSRVTSEWVIEREGARWLIVGSRTETKRY
ncbi:MAG: hypothetical protein ACRDKF_03155 [Actinomycetota bacterium]